MDPHDMRARQSAWLKESIDKWSPTLNGRVAVVTGGARGLGQALAEGLAHAGVKVVALDKTWDGSEAFGKQLAADEGLALECDVTSDEQVDAAYARVMERFGTADILINNAGLVTETLWPPFGHRPILETTDRDWEIMFAVNLFGVVKMTRRFIQPMLEQGRGSIINCVSSGALAIAGGGGWFGFRPSGLEAPYQSTKAAIMTLGFYLAAEVRDRGVAVNSFMPGHTRASWFDETFRAYAATGSSFYGLRPCIPAHALPLVLFLAAQDGSGTTGILFSVPDWNYDHGFGDYKAWLDYDLPADLEQTASQFEQMMKGLPTSTLGLTTPAMRFF